MFKPSPRHAFLAAAVLFAVLAVVAGLAYSGSPGTERTYRLDEERSTHLDQIANAVITYADQNGGVPESLDQLTNIGDGKAGYWLPSLTDPVTMEKYEYERTGLMSYRLCAEFQAPSRPVAPYEPRPAVTPSSPAPDFRTHDAGTVCWDADLSSRAVGCSGGLSCPVGQTCALLAAHGETPVCVPAGRECAWAGCPGACDILKSNPLQVVCREEVTNILNPPTRSGGAANCQLMRNARTGEVNCFGCTSGQEQDVCTEPPPGWETFAPSGEVGIPYACYASPTKGCQLAQ